MRSDKIKQGFERAPHRSLLRATGLSAEAIDKPFIAICNSYTDIIPGHVHLSKVADLIKKAIRQGRRHAVRVQHHRHLRRHRHGPRRHEVLPAQPRAHRRLRGVHGQRAPFDGMICIPNCDKIVPGMLMGALRCNIPTIFVSGGPMRAGKMPDGRTVDLISVFEGVGALKAGKITEAAA